MDHLQEALQHLRQGRPVLLFDSDSREGETDIVVPAEHLTPNLVRVLREEAGGLVCTAVAPEHHAKLGLPFLHDLTQGAAGRYPVLGELVANDIRYDASKSSFGISVNHRDTFTGIPDQDRSHTVRSLAAFLGGISGVPDDEARRRFGAQFRTPGHCILLNGSPGGLATRQGHTELSLELMRQAGLVPCATLCEMLDGRSGRALGQKEARAYAAAKGWVFLTGQEVLDAWKARTQRQPRPLRPAARRPTRAAPTSAS